jgi:hypothetical protein
LSTDAHKFPQISWDDLAVVMLLIPALVWHSSRQQFALPICLLPPCGLEEAEIYVISPPLGAKKILRLCPYVSMCLKKTIVLHPFRVKTAKLNLAVTLCATFPTLCAGQVTPIYLRP